jgi:hypothetical protein
VLSDAARHDLKASIGQAGAERGSVTVQVLVRDGMLMDNVIIIFPL